jgi:hypothetical protein
MSNTIYQNNDVEITVERVDFHESKINVNGHNLIWISAIEQEDFRHELSALLDKYRI